MGISVGTRPTQGVKLLPAEKYNFLGISIVGQSNERGDGGIYIGSIMKGGAVAADGRIEPGDMLLQVASPAQLWHSWAAGRDPCPLGASWPLAWLPCPSALHSLLPHTQSSLR